MKKTVESLYQLQTLEMQPRKSSEEQIQALRQGIPADMLAHYDRRKSRGKKGVAVVRNGVCTGCHLRVPIGVFNAVVLGEEKIACGNCGSFLLHLPEPESTPIAAPASAATKPAKAAKAAKVLTAV